MTRDKTLIESLLLYIHNRERDIVRKCLDDASKVIIYKGELWDILIDCEVSTPRNERNFKELMIEAAKKQFIQKLFYILKKMQIGLRDFWNDLAINEIDDIRESYKANSFNILKSFNFESAVTLSEENVLAYLKRFLRNPLGEPLALVLHFCTRSSAIDNSEKIKIIFLNQNSRNYCLSAKSCFKILHLPKRIESFSRFKLLWEDTLRNPSNWVMED